MQAAGSGFESRLVHHILCSGVGITETHITSAWETGPVLNVSQAPDLLSLDIAWAGSNPACTNLLRIGGTMPTKIYLATPYSHQDTAVMEQRFDAVNKIAAQLLNDGHHVYSPISHTHPIALAGELPKTWDFWEAYDRVFLEWADELYVYMQDGWEKSVGVKAEIEIAHSMSKPVFYIAPEIGTSVVFDDSTQAMLMGLTHNTPFQEIVADWRPV